MEIIDAFGPKLIALMSIVALAYVLLTFAPLWWPAIVAWRARPALPRPWLFIGVVAALVYGVFSFLAFAIILPVEAYGIFVVPQLEDAGIAPPGVPVIRVFGIVVDSWWLLIPLTQLFLTWYITRQLQAKWHHICSAPPN